MGEGQDVTVASNVLGTMGTILWCVQLVPQIWYNWKQKKTDGLPLAMMFLWATCAVPMGSYLILQEVNIPLQIQPQIFCFFALICWGQILHYNHNYGRLKTTLCVTAMAALLSGIEALLIFTLRILHNKGVRWLDLIVGIMGAVLLVAGILPAYFEIWKRDGRVIGINWVFLSMDTLGGLFSLFALAAQGTFDILGGIMYLIVVLSEAGICASHLGWRIRYRKLRNEARAAGKTIDEILDLQKNSTKESRVIREKFTLPDDLETQTRVAPASVWSAA